MDFEDVIRGRRSIRAYADAEVPPDLLQEILDDARWAPSWRNTQAWNVWVLTGNALERFKEAYKAAVAAEEPAALDLGVTTEWPAACSARTAELMRERTAALDAAGEPSDPESSLARMADLYDAPCLLIVGFDDCLSAGYASFDSGALVQSVCLAAHDHGLGTCVVATVVRYPDLLRRTLPDAADTRFVVAVTLGYPDTDAAINSFERSRAPLEEIVRWVE